MTKKASKNTELVKSFEEALDILESRSPGIKEEFEAISQLKTRYSRRIINEFKLMIIIEVLNEGWIPDWKNFSQRKWYPWFYIDSTGAIAGLGYVSSIHAASYTNASLGSWLCCKSEKLAEYAGRTFLPLYNEMLLG
jgi:hypothetical protein